LIRCHQEESSARLCYKLSSRAFNQVKSHPVEDSVRLKVIEERVQCHKVESLLRSKIIHAVESSVRLKT